MQVKRELWWLLHCHYTSVGCIVVWHFDFTAVCVVASAPDYGERSTSTSTIRKAVKQETPEATLEVINDLLRDDVCFVLSIIRLVSKYGNVMQSYCSLIIYRNSA